MPVALRVALRRAATTLVIMLAAAVVSVLAMEALGDPIRALLPAEAPPDQVAQVRQRLGLDRPLAERLATRLTGALSGDFGRSYATGEPAGALVAGRLPATLTLVGLGALAGVAGGLGFGLLAFRGRRGPAGRLPIGLLLTWQAVPAFVIAILGIRLFASELRLLPPSGSGRPETLVLPALVLGFDLAAALALYLDSRLVDLERVPFSTVARGKGLSEARFSVAHLLPAALPGLASFSALRLSRLAGGTLVIEEIFAYGGLGQLALFGLRNRDLPVVLACTVCTVLLIGLLRLVFDLLEPVFDPTAGVQL